MLTNNPTSFRRNLLATTCLTVASATPSLAGVITEGLGGAPADFDSSPTGFVLPGGTTAVTGNVGFCGFEGGDCSDWFEFNGLTAGDLFTISAILNEGISPSLGANVTTHALAGLGSASFGSSSTVIAQGVVPGDGKLAVGVFAVEEAAGNYTVSLATSANGVPEPSALAPMGLALAGALAWRRRRSQGSN